MRHTAPGIANAFTDARLQEYNPAYRPAGHGHKVRKGHFSFEDVPATTQISSRYIRERNKKLERLWVVFPNSGGVFAEITTMDAYRAALALVGGARTTTENNPNLMVYVSKHSKPNETSGQTEYDMSNIIIEGQHTRATYRLLTTKDRTALAQRIKNREHIHATEELQRPKSSPYRINLDKTDPLLKTLHTLMVPPKRTTQRVGNAASIAQNQTLLADTRRQKKGWAELFKGQLLIAQQAAFAKAREDNETPFPPEYAVRSWSRYATQAYKYPGLLGECVGKPFVGMAILSIAILAEEHKPGVMIGEGFLSITITLLTLAAIANFSAQKLVAFEQPLGVKREMWDVVAWQRRLLADSSFSATLQRDAAVCGGSEADIPTAADVQSLLLTFPTAATVRPNPLHAHVDWTTGATRPGAPAHATAVTIASPTIGTPQYKPTEMPWGISLIQLAGNFATEELDGTSFSILMLFWAGKWLFNNQLELTIAAGTLLFGPLKFMSSGLIAMNQVGMEQLASTQFMHSHGKDIIAPMALRHPHFTYFQRRPLLLMAVVIQGLSALHGYTFTHEGPFSEDAHRKIGFALYGLFLWPLTARIFTQFFGSLLGSATGQKELQQFAGLFKRPSIRVFMRLVFGDYHTRALAHCLALARCQAEQFTSRVLTCTLFALFFPPLVALFFVAANGSMDAICDFGAVRADPTQADHLFNNATTRQTPCVALAGFNTSAPTYHHSQFADAMVAFTQTDAGIPLGIHTWGMLTMLLVAVTTPCITIHAAWRSNAEANAALVRNIRQKHGDGDTLPDESDSDSRHSRYSISSTRSYPLTVSGTGSVEARRRSAQHHQAQTIQNGGESAASSPSRAERADNLARQSPTARRTRGRQGSHRNTLMPGDAGGYTQYKAAQEASGTIAQGRDGYTPQQAAAMSKTGAP